MLNSGRAIKGLIVLVVSFLLLLPFTPTAIAEAPVMPLSKLNNREKSYQNTLSREEILKEIDELCKEYDFPYPTFMKNLVKAESSIGENRNCGDGGKSCGIFQYREKTWKMFQKKFNRPDLSYNNDRDQIEMTILALRGGYWYYWGSLKRKYQRNPI